MAQLRKKRLYSAFFLVFDLGSFQYLTQQLSNENGDVYNKWHTTQWNYLLHHTLFIENIQAMSLIHGWRLYATMVKVEILYYSQFKMVVYKAKMNPKLEITEENHR